MTILPIGILANLYNLSYCWSFWDMKADTRDFDLDKKLDDIERDIQKGRADTSLWRRARRILRIKIYFLFHERGLYNPENAIRILNSFPAEGKIIIWFIFSLLVLAILVASWPVIHPVYGPSADIQSGPPGLAISGFFSRISGFMAMVMPTIVIVVVVSIIFSILSRIAS